MGVAEWEQESDNWVRWARTPGFDAYWQYRAAFFEAIVPPPGRRALEIGCGEGRVARDLASRGHRVTALDPAHGLIRHARAADPAGRYLVADGARLPFAAGSFDLVVAYNALQVVADMAGTVAEAARVLVAGGHLCVCVAHPVTDLGHFEGDVEPARYVLRAHYYERARVEETVTSGGLTMTFRGWTHTLEDYAVALQRSGFAIEAVREPKPAPGSRHERWTQVPLFMTLRAAKR